ncbi:MULTISPECIES: hypothetical protein [Desulfosporosinus]|uniref:Uncharacterized protein n=2 Tax=Desulfosporosinus TaxID=79206 RepID=A0A1G8IZW7_9FIRM|nr:MULTISPECIES: hypothetical protein [Desulfosporosinus]AFQ42384.1 hypothetical protein Desmer_0323 [Desulfosporosinus meridiei DSM 13257]SDI24504.1 hypothetical protein SAMN05443529_13052 [Desulfosporosinus hippei DSM 8344]
MAQSSCIKCGNTQFEVVHANNLEGTTRSVLFVQCKSCGSVVGVLDFLNVSVKAERMKNDLRILAEKILTQIKDS